MKKQTSVILSEGVTIFVTPESKDPYSGIDSLKINDRVKKS